jgi:hypothetical protein
MCLKGRANNQQPHACTAQIGWGTGNARCGRATLEETARFPPWPRAARGVTGGTAGPLAAASAFARGTPPTGVSTRAPAAMPSSWSSPSRSLFKAAAMTAPKVAGSISLHLECPEGSLDTGGEDGLVGAGRRRASRHTARRVHPTTSPLHHTAPPHHAAPPHRATRHTDPPYTRTHHLPRQCEHVEMDNRKASPSQRAWEVRVVEPLGQLVGVQYRASCRPRC